MASMYLASLIPPVRFTSVYVFFFFLEATGHNNEQCLLLANYSFLSLPSVPASAAVMLPPGGLYFSLILYSRRHFAVTFLDLKIKIDVDFTQVGKFPVLRPA